MLSQILLLQPLSPSSYPWPQPWAPGKILQHLETFRIQIIPALCVYELVVSSGDWWTVLLTNPTFLQVSRITVRSLINISFYSGWMRIISIVWRYHTVLQYYIDQGINGQFFDLQWQHLGNIQKYCRSRVNFPLMKFTLLQYYLFTTQHFFEFINIFRMSSATLWVDMYLNASSTRAAQNALTLYAADIYGHEGRNINSVQISPH